MKTNHPPQWDGPHPTDPHPRKFSSARVEYLHRACEHTAHRHGHDFGGFLDVLVMMAGLEMNDSTRASALRYLQTSAGTPDVLPLAIAISTVERFRQVLAREQAVAQRCTVRDVKNCTAGEDGLVSRNPNLTRSCVRNPQRLRLVR